MPILRASEWISLLAFSGFAVLAWRRDLDRVRRIKIAGIGAGGLAFTLFAPLILPSLRAPHGSAIARDCIPCALLLLFYSQSGQFVTRVDRRIEAHLEQLDQRWIAPRLEWCARLPFGAWVFTFLELAYLSYYVSIPLAVGALYWFGRERKADYLWTVVLLAAYGSCSLLPFIQTRPPRMVGEKWSACLPCGKVRAFNLWILRHGSIQANTFPSAHVAIATAGAFAFFGIGPAWIAWSFLGLAIGVALGAVAGRYHYGADAVLGLIVAAAALLSGAALAACGVIG